MKAYADTLAARVKNSNAWPGIPLLENFNDLQSQASDALSNKSLEGNLAAMLLMHQIAEEFLRALDEDAVLYMQIKLYPYPYLPSRRRRRMYGQVLEDLHSSVWFPNKKYICERAHELNQLRIPMVHGLTKPGALRAVVKNIERAWELYKIFAWLALEAHLGFHAQFAEYQEDDSWPPQNVEFMSEGGASVE